MSNYRNNLIQRPFSNKRPLLNKYPLPFQCVYVNKRALHSNMRHDNEERDIIIIIIIIVSVIIISFPPIFMQSKRMRTKENVLCLRRLYLSNTAGCRRCAVVGPLASSHFDPGSTPGPGVHMWVKLLLVLILSLKETFTSGIFRVNYLSRNLDSVSYLVEFELLRESFITARSLKCI